MSAALLEADHGLDPLGLPLAPVAVAVPVGPAVEVRLTVRVADTPEVYRYRILAGAGASRLARSEEEDEEVGPPASELVVTAPRAALVRWIHDGALLGHLLVDGAGEVGGDLVALSFVDGWMWFRRQDPAAGLPVAVRALVEGPEPQRR